MKRIAIALVLTSLLSANVFAGSRFCKAGQQLLTNASAETTISETVTGRVAGACYGTVVTTQPYACSGGGSRGTLTVTYYNQMVSCYKADLNEDVATLQNVPDMFAVYTAEEDKPTSNP